MKITLVLPVRNGSGEIITAIHMADQLTRGEHVVSFISSPFGETFVRKSGAWQVTCLGEDEAINGELFRSHIKEFVPDLIIFCDFHLLFSAGASVPLPPKLVFEEMESWSVTLATLDHFGYGRNAKLFFSGPPHFGFGIVSLPDLPKGMHRFLPCPMHDHLSAKNGDGHAFRYWDLPLKIDPEASESATRPYRRSDGELVVFHLVPNWVCGAVSMLGLSFYRHVGKLYSYYFNKLDRPVTILSLNNGHLLPCMDGAVRLFNLPPTDKDAFENFLQGSDLICTENRMSISISKAACYQKPSIVFRNSWSFAEVSANCEPEIQEIALDMEHDRIGTIFPYDVYPCMRPQDSEQMGVIQSSYFRSCFEDLEIFGGLATADRICKLLNTYSQQQGKAQLEYVKSVQALPDAVAIIDSIMQKCG